MTKITALQVQPFLLLGFVQVYRVDEVVTIDGAFHSAKPVAIFFDFAFAEAFAQSIPATTENI